MCNLEQSKFAPVGASLPGVHILIMDNEFNVKSIGISGEVKLNLYIDIFFYTSIYMYI